MRSGVPKIVRAVAAATLVLTAGAHGWLVNSARELHAGLLSFDSGGERWSNADLVAAARDNGPQHVSAVYSVAGHVLFGLAVRAAALLVVAAFTAARWLRRVTLGVFVLILVVFGAFMWTQPTGPAFGLQVGWSALVFFNAVWIGAMLRGGLPRRSA